MHKYTQDFSLRWEAWWHSTECQLSTTTFAKSPPPPWGSLPQRLRDHHSRNSEGDIWRCKDVIGHETRLEVEGWAKGSLPHRTAKGSTVVVNPTKAASRKHGRTDQGHMRACETINQVKRGDSLTQASAASLAGRITFARAEVGRSGTGSMWHPSTRAV